MLPHNSLLIPSAQKYARRAIQTLGYSNRTTGYWPHTAFVCAYLYAVDEFVTKRHELAMLVLIYLGLGAQSIARMAVDVGCQ